MHAFPIIGSKSDTLTQSQMLKQADKKNFIQAQLPELDGLAKMGVFEILPMTSKPPTAKLLSSICSYRRKSNPVGDILKWKACLCLDGSQQEHGRNYWETYASVISWPTIRLLLLLSLILGLKTRQVDYTQAFPQAPLDDPVFMHLPQGFAVDELGHLHQHIDLTFHDKTHFIKLEKNLYGSKQVAQNWFFHLSKGLLSLGFTPSKIDPCLFLCSDCFLAVYTDNCLIFAHQDSTTQNLIRSLKGSIQDYLGIHIIKDPT